MSRPRKNPAKSPDAAFEGAVRAIGRPILKKLKKFDKEFTEATEKRGAYAFGPFRWPSISSYKAIREAVTKKPKK